MTALSEDQTIRSTDRARLKGYLKTWKQSKMLIGAAMYVDVLKSPSFLSLSLQKEKLDIVLSIQHILKSSKSLKTMAGQDPLLWPTVKLFAAELRTRMETRSTRVQFLATTIPQLSRHVETRLQLISTGWRKK